MLTILTSSRNEARYLNMRGGPLIIPFVDHHRLDRDFTKEELFAALGFMNNDKSPGVGGVPYEFYKDMWDTAGDDFSHMASNAFSTRCLTVFIN